MNSRILLIAVIAIAAVAGGAFALSSYSPEQENQAQSDTIAEEQQDQMEESGDMMEESGEMAMEKYSGETIAGSTTPYVRYNEADFEKAMSEGKAIYIYFYATWCPICAFERPNVLAAFDELDVENAVGFEAHWRDGQDTEADQNLARAYGVSSQHTHLFIDANGNLVEKTLTSQSKEDIKSKIAEAAQV